MLLEMTEQKECFINVSAKFITKIYDNFIWSVVNKLTCIRNTVLPLRCILATTFLHIEILWDPGRPELLPPDHSYRSPRKFGRRF